MARPLHAFQEQPAFVEKLRSGKPILFKPRGRSMEPNLTDGTIVMVDPLRRLPKRGDVVLVAVAHMITLHRVVKLRGPEVWLMGDAMRRLEGPYPLEYVVGIARLSPLTLWQRLRLAVKRLVFA